MSSGFRFLPARASTIAGSVDALYFFLVGMTAFFTLLIAILIITFAIRYRRRETNQVGTRVETSHWVELSWMLIPFVFGMIAFFWGAFLFGRMSYAPADAMDIHVVGHQWMWKIQHPTGNQETNELHVPIGTAIKLTMISQDVIHSFFVPAFRVKQDVLPGRYTHAWFEPSAVGVYHLFCAEYCGTKHSGMIGRVIVMEQADYEQWVASTRDLSLEAVGKRLFDQLGCLNCHATQSPRGPSLANLYGKEISLADGSTVLADDSYLRESILDPQKKVVAGFSPIMPSFRGQLREEELVRLIAYLKRFDQVEAGAEGQGRQRSAGEEKADAPAKADPKTPPTKSEKSGGNPQ